MQLVPRIRSGRRRAPFSWGFAALAAMVLAIIAAEGQGLSWGIDRMTAAAEPAAKALSGQARIVDGDTLAIGDTRIRLWGIDAPETRQTCEGKAGGVYECGQDAAAALREVIGGRPVQCTERDR